MIRNYKIVTLTHKQAPLSELSQIMLQHDSEQELQAALEALKDAFGIAELLYLSTCNRVTFFIDLPGPISPNFLHDFCQHINPDLEASRSRALVDKLVFWEGQEALQHLFEIAASIDSMVIGEREILRQLREAYHRCMDWGLTGDNIRLAMKTTVEAAKEVYAKTRIGEKPISIVSLAIQQLLRSNLSRSARILLIGAGQTNTLVAKFLKKHEFVNVAVFNRSFDKAERLSQLIGEQSKALPLDQLEHYQEGFDAIITCTGHTHSWIDPTLYQQLLQGDHSPKLVIDLAVPNNLTEATRQEFPLHYIDVENLRGIARENLAFREREVTQAQELLASRLLEFHNLYQRRGIERAMRRVPEAIKAVKSHAMNEVFRKELEDLNPESRQLLERMMDYMERRCISIPMQAAKSVVR